MEKHEFYFATDADGNASLGFGLEETLEAIGEYQSPPARVVCLSVSMDTPTADTNEDAITVVDVVVPPEDPEDGDGEEAPAEVPAEDEPEAPPELPAEVPAQQPEPATVAA
jgi:hypothetical protein